MKYIQVIDGAENCTYSIFGVEDDEFEILFPDETDIEFSDDVFKRLGYSKAAKLMAKIWKRPIEKKSVIGIHGTIFYGMAFKKKFYPTKRDSEMI